MRKRTTLVVALALVLGATSGCVPENARLREHVLNRIGFGPDAWSRARIDQLGADAYIAEQLQPGAIPDGPVQAMLAAYDTLDMTFAERVLLTEGMMPGMPMMSNQALLEDAWEAKALRAMYSRRQLQEVLVDFWFNHFNVLGNGGGFAAEGLVPYERDAIRPHVLGRFEDMLQAVAKSPSMLYYLDNWRSRLESEEVVSTRMNENYSRELLEIHTVGVDNYTQQDVEEVARCFTGWTIDATLDDGFYFEPTWHDYGSKVVLGELLIPAGGGVSDGEAVLSYLASHPATAENLARKLIQRFVADEPPAVLVTAVRDVYLASDGDLKQVMEAILGSPYFKATTSFRSKVKRPLHFAVSTARAVGTTTVDAVLGVHQLTSWAGEALYRERSPTGYPEVSEAWMGPGALIERVNFQWGTINQTNGFLFAWPVQSTGDDGILFRDLQTWLFAGPLSNETRQSWLDFAAIQPQYVVGQKRVEVMTYALLTSPEFFLH